MDDLASESYAAFAAAEAAAAWEAAAVASGSSHSDPDDLDDLAPRATPLGDLPTATFLGVDDPTVVSSPSAPQPPLPPEEEDDEDGEEEDVVCRICGKGPKDDGRILCRFLPVPADPATAHLHPPTVSEDIALHIFCGKTASILSHINKPELEILSKAGIKNKHGIGAEVNGALARTRSSSVLEGKASKEKCFYLVKEFEANLQAVRNASANLDTSGGLLPAPTPIMTTNGTHTPQTPPPPATGPPYNAGALTSLCPLAPSGEAAQGRTPTLALTNKPVVHKSGLPTFSKARSSSSNGTRIKSIQQQQQSDGKIHCECGGIHLPIGTPKGDSSWRSHVMTKRHQKWMKEHGLLGI